ncbi:heterokaryon incompatibility protein-domain-containing protein [Hypoxylon rubiginosum]|uniref:Heterokaryon incompatibility protein-domain-containing protein n=1 Tax=Hypoxylon rubiginosum TaxID=110542 RepID=A0ACC0CRH4_9PEZI|nr:heterokaryon incompatibility protein-domain-containing protein [Hypoxylon rubiginosum]
MSSTIASTDTDERDEWFPHVPLQGARDIRLVRILPKANDLDGFELKLSTTHLDDPIPYVALSYTWEAAELDPKTGDFAPTLKFEVRCHGGYIKVTENLLDFLQRARQTADISETYYWIDQISINQADPVERARQVAMMGSIYKAAGNVHIWLGKNNPSPQFLWVYNSFIPLILRLDGELRDRGISLGSNSWDCSTPELVQGLGASVCKEWRENYEAFFWFFYIRRWFLRAWILQEVTLKDPSQIRVSCGDEEFSWEVFESFTRFVERSSWHHSLPFLYVTWAEKLVGPMVPLLNLLKGRRYIDMQVRGGSELQNWKANFIWDIGPQDERQIWYSIFLHFLRTTRFMSAKDPRDHIYSLLGMLAEFLPTGMECPFTPDYEAPTVNVFKDVATHILKNTPSLYLLSTVSFGLCNGEIVIPGGRAGWPSWVPDFSDETAFAPSLSTTVYMVSNGKQYYNASKIDTIEYQPPTVHDEVLTVYGAQIGTVGKCNDRRRVVSGSENLPFLCFILDLCVRGEAQYLSSSQTWIEAVWRTMMVDCIPANWDTQPSALFRSWLFEHIVCAIKFKGREHGVKSYLESKATVVGLLRRISNDPYLSSALPTWEEVEQKTSGYVDQDHVEKHPFELLACESFLTGRWYLTTGGYLGSGPASITEGDEIWLLKGGKMPMILRKAADNQHRLVGESYLHGAMYGESMTDELVSRMGPVEII